MGGKGVGHKSVRALLSRQVNIQKARAARRRAPLPWRSAMESRVIEQLVWQWFQDSGQWTVASGQNKKPRAWAKARVARLLGVSHTWVNKLVKRMEADPERMRRKMRAFAPANLDTLERGREETRWERERGRLRGPIRWRRVKVKIQGREMRMGVPTKEEMRRREKLKAVTSGEWLASNFKTKVRCGWRIGRRRRVRCICLIGRCRSGRGGCRSWAPGMPRACDRPLRRERRNRCRSRLGEGGKSSG